MRMLSNMTYRQLRDVLANMNDQNLDQYVTVHVPGLDELSQIDDMRSIGNTMLAGLADPDLPCLFLSEDYHE